MSTISPTRPLTLRLPEVWPSLAIGVIWLTVLLDALFGPDILTSNGSGTNTSSVPSAVVVPLFAFLSTWVVARYGFRRRNED
jgi:hypothetical protein